MTLFVEEDRIHLRKSVSTNSPLDGRQVERKCPWEQNLNIKRKKEEKKKKKRVVSHFGAKPQNQEEHKKGQSLIQILSLNFHTQNLHLQAFFHMHRAHQSLDV